MTGKTKIGRIWDTLNGWYNFTKEDYDQAKKEAEGLEDEQGRITGQDC